MNAAATTLEWRPVPGFPAYEVSQRGDFRRITSARGSRAGRLLNPYRRPGGYVTIYLSKGHGDGGHYLVHRIVCEVFHGPAPTSSHEVAHGDGDPWNNDFSNLRWATRSENSADRRLHGTDCRGDRHPARKLTSEQVLEIRSGYKGIHGEQVAIARRYGVSRAAISLILTGQTWTHLAAAA